MSQPAQPDRYRVSVDEYRSYRADGFLVVRQLVSQAEVEAVKAHAMDILEGRCELPGVAAPPAGATPEELIKRFTRIHMLHRVDPMSEQTLLQRRILDVLEALIGPEVLALQTMLFYNPPGLGGQGWHQDSYYITTYPDTLIGAWLALEPADEANGCLWVAPGSHVEPIYPDRDRGSLMHAEHAFGDLHTIENASHLDDAANTLAPVAKRYEKVAVPVEPGDVIYFHGHLLHRSYPNQTGDRWRRAFVSHYCNARSWVPWNHGAPYEGDAGNDQHILARGTTHLPFAQPKFGTPCAATEDATSRGAQRLMPDDDGMMMPADEVGSSEGVAAWDPGNRWKR